jgi:hypothetical protein
VHDGTIGLDWPTEDVVAILQVYNDNFRLGGIVGFLTDAEVVVGFKGLGEREKLDDNT